MTIRIHYTRPPDRTTVFRQHLVHRTGDCAVTLMEHAELTGAVRAGGRVILEPGAPVVWFTFDDAWHDIGRFHTTAGAFTGCYANILTPVEFRAPDEWHTTDLFLDVWAGADGTVLLLDEAELDRSIAAGAVDARLATTAIQEAQRLLAAARSGTWPPPIVADWTLDRARAALARGGTRDADGV
ncbi:MAG: DUF402 domain-containing protein [Gemmatimonadota bacterium]